MDKSKKISGIDISKDFFDLVDQKSTHMQYSNDSFLYSDKKWNS